MFVSLLKKNWLPWDITPLPAYHEDLRDPNYFVVLKKRQRDEHKWNER